MITNFFNHLRGTKKMNIEIKDLNEISSSIKKISEYVNSNETNRKKIFEIAEKNGIHITPTTYYQPIPDTRTISQKLFEGPLHHKGIDVRVNFQLEMLKKLSKFSNELKQIPQKKSDDLKQYYFENPMFGHMDAVIYYSIIREFKPTQIIEVGSGFSTMIASQASKQNKNTSIISIEPYPNKILKSGLPNLVDLIRKPVQEIDIEKFKELKENDILFIDSSHVSKINSDVNYLYLHVIPELNSGVIIHIHDFFFPYEYPKKWILEEKKFWNEYYLVWAFLIGNTDYEIILSNHFLRRQHSEDVNQTFPMLKGKMGAGSLWIRKK